MLTVRDDDEKLFEAIKNGAQGYLLKSIHSHELLSMLRSAIRGEAALTPALSGRMLEEFRTTEQLPDLKRHQENRRPDPPRARSPQPARRRARPTKRSPRR